MRNLCVILLALLLLSMSCKGIFNPAYDVTYAVIGSTRMVFITFRNESGGTSQQDNCKLPWQYDFTAEPGAFLYISAQNMEDDGNVTVKIYVDGKPKKSSTSSGAYVIATVSMSL